MCFIFFECIESSRVIISRNCASFKDEISTSRKSKLSIAARSNYSNMLRYIPIDVRCYNALRIAAICKHIIGHDTS